MQERRKFGSLGFNIRYEFNASDLECSSSTLNMFLSSQDAIPWEALEYVIGQVNYGGRYAPCCLAAYLRPFVHSHAAAVLEVSGRVCVHVPLASCDLPAAGAAGVCLLSNFLSVVCRVSPSCSVTDDLDRRCLMSVLRQFINPRVVQQECAALTASGTYCVPKGGSIESYLDSIRAMPP